MFSDQKALHASLMEVESNSRRWESEAKEVVEWAVRAKKERDATRHEVAMARLDTEAAGIAQAKVESELARVQHALVASEDARQKVESQLDMVQQALATSGEAWRKTEEEANRLTNVPLSTIFMEVSLGFQTGCRTRQSHYL